jgi:hypothetical protein
MMKRFDFRTIFGVGLIVLGGLMLLEKFNIIHGASNLFWGLVFIVGAVYFGMVFLRAPQTRWWAVFPAAALLGLGGAAFLPQAFSGWGGGIFLGTLGLGFFVVYSVNRANWWAIIPGGVLLTLAAVSSLTETETFSALGSGSLFFIGLGFTFLLVALLPNPVGANRWAYIPAIVLVLMGGLLGTQATAGLVGYVWPTALIVAGLLVIWGFFKNRD